MLVDTSALIAVLKREDGWVDLRAVLLELPIAVPAPVLVEAHVVARRTNLISPDRAAAFLAEMTAMADIIAFGTDHAAAAASADERYGKGRGNAAKLNLLDLMVYGVAKVMGLPILCTGNDFASTDAVIHPASRVG